MKHSSGDNLHWFCRVKAIERIVESLVEIHSPFTLQNSVSLNRSEQEGLDKKVRMGSTLTSHTDQHSLAFSVEIPAKLLDK